MLTPIHIALLALFSVKLGLSQYEAGDLEEKLLDKYNTNIRPVEDVSTTTSVSNRLTPYQLIDFDAKSQTLTMLMWQRAQWTDDRLSWNPENYGGVNVLRLKMEQIWLPDLIPYNDMHEFDPMNYADSIPVKVFPSGTVQWQTPVVMQTICPMDVTNFPYDQHTCNITIGSWTFMDNELSVYCDQDDLDLSNYAPALLWMLKSATCTRVVQDFGAGGVYSFLSNQLHFQRLNNYYIKNLILPNAFLLALGGLMFFLPTSCCDRAGFGMTILLALGVNMMVVAEYLPETSKNFPKIGNYFLGSVIATCFACLVVAISLIIQESIDDSQDSAEGEAWDSNKENTKPRVDWKAYAKLADRIMGIFYPVFTTGYTALVLYQTKNATDI